MKAVIISAPMLLEDGTFRRETISLEEAGAWVTANAPTNYVGHSTVRVVGVEPSTERAQCSGFDQALALKVRGRLDFGKEYSVDEILEIGVDAILITKV